MKVITFGEILLRLEAPGYTKLFQKENLEATFCGSEANVAVSLSIFGLDTSLVTRLPDNEVGHSAQNAIRCFGVCTDNVVYGQGRMGLFYLEKGASQRPSRVIYDRENSSFALSKETDFNWDEIFNDADWFHWSGINPAISSELASICENACKSAKERGLVVSCDLNYREKLWSTSKAQRIMKPLMKYVDVCICNEEDADRVLGIKNPNSDTESGDLSKTDYLHTAEKICGRYSCEYVATTLRRSYSASRNGWSAMLYDAKTKKPFFSKEYDIQIIDRVGGGDSFAAALIFAMTKHMDNQRAIEFAAAASCLKQTIEGDFNRTTVSDVELLLDSGGNGRVQR